MKVRDLKWVWVFASLVGGLAVLGVFFRDNREMSLELDGSPTHTPAGAQSGNPTVLERAGDSSGSIASISRTAEAEGSQLIGGESEKRELPDAGWVIRFAGEGSSDSISGIFKAIPLTLDLQNLISSDIAFNGDDIAEMRGFTELPIQSGKVDCRGMDPSVEYFAWTEVTGFQSTGWFVEFPTSIDVVTLHPAKGLNVQVLNDRDEPVPGIRVEVFYSTADTGYLGLSWRERIQRKYFYWSKRSDNNGRAVLEFPLSESMTVSSQQVEGINISVVYAALDGDEVILRAVPGITVFGRVVDDDGMPIERGFVGFLFQGESRTEDAGSTFIGDNGEFLCRGVVSTQEEILAIAYCDGYSIDYHSIHEPRPGQEIRIDFILRKAIPVRIRLLFPSGEPASDIDFMASTNGYDWVPGSYRTDSRGLAVTAPSFVPKTDYLLRWWSSDWEGPMVEFTSPEDPDQLVDVPLPGMGKLEGIDEVCVGVSLAQARFEFQPDGDQRGGIVTWVGEEKASPWLPVGCGFLSLILSDGSRETRRVVITEGSNPCAPFGFSREDLRFTLPEAGNSGFWKLSTVDPAGFRSSYSQLEAGPQSLSLPEGQYSLCVETDSPGGYVLGPFMLPVGGLDLGTLSIGTGAIYGTVEKPDEKPWPRMRVEIWRDDNWFGGESLTNEAGEFSFDTLGPGLYKIVVVPSRSHLVFAAEQMVWVQLHAGENVRTPTFQIAQDSGIKCQLRGSFSLARSGFLWDGARLELAPIGADGTFSFSNRGSESIVGIYSIQSSALQVIQEKVGDPEIPHLFLAESLSSQVYRFLLPNGQPAAGASVKFLVGNGFCLPGSATLNSEGNLELKSSGCEDSSLLVAVGGMESYRVHFRDLIHGDNFLGGEHLWSEISCFDLSGIPIHGATLWNPSDHCQTITNERGYGRISGKPSGGYLLIEKEGFWSIRAEPLPSFAVVLRRTVDHVLLSTPIGLPISELEVTPLFSLGYQFSLVVSRGPGVDEWVLRGIPEGAFSVRGLGNDGSILLDTSVTLSAKSSRHVPLN